MANYLYEATSVEGFVQQLALRYLPSGYRYYVSGIIQEGKDPRAVDARILQKYDIAVDKWERHRRKRAGRPNLQYLRYRRRFLILCTGEDESHPFFQTEREVRDVQRVPIRFSGYEISHRAGKVWVRIDRDDFRAIRGYFLAVASKRRAADLAAEIHALPYQPYRSVKYQLYRLVADIIDYRAAAGRPPLDKCAVPARRTICHPFEFADGEPRELVLGWRDDDVVAGGEE
jgi:hypothetical protein